jgi:hypothetical protein
VIHELEQKLDGKRAINNDLEVGGVVTAEAFVGGTVTADSFVGDGSSLTNLPMSLPYTNTVWDDLTLSALNLRDPPGGESPPALQEYIPSAGVTNVLLDFNDGQRAYGILQMKHSYKRDSEVRPHIHWTSTVNCTSTWELAMSFGHIEGGMTNTYRQSSIFTNLTARKHVMSSFPAVTDMTNRLGESGIFLISLKCVSAGAASTNGPLLLDFDIHFQSDKLGSDNENPHE